MKKLPRNKITLLAEKFNDLHIRERAIRNKYDPSGRHEEAHIYIDDLRQDYEEEVRNLGFSKQRNLIERI
jgi:hypothetical protein